MPHVPVTSLTISGTTMYDERRKDWQSIVLIVHTDTNMKMKASELAVQKQNPRGKDRTDTKAAVAVRCPRIFEKKNGWPDKKGRARGKEEGVIRTSHG
jgi:hypothetical protein